MQTVQLTGRTSVSSKKTARCPWLARGERRSCYMRCIRFSSAREASVDQLLLACQALLDQWQ